MTVSLRIGFALLGFAASAGVAAGAQEHSAKDAGATAAAAQEFEARVNQYVELRKKQSGSQNGSTKSATKLVENREELRARIQANRANAKQGDIFVPVAAGYIRKQIASALKGQRGTRVVASLRRSEPVKDIPLKVNAPYPDGVPLQSMPPTLLLKLPKLPKELEYRIVGRN